MNVTQEKPSEERSCDQKKTDSKSGSRRDGSLKHLQVKTSDYQSGEDEGSKKSKIKLAGKKSLQKELERGMWTKIP